MCISGNVGQCAGHDATQPVQADPRGPFRGGSTVGIDDLWAEDAAMREDCALAPDDLMNEAPDLHVAYAS